MCLHLKILPLLIVSQLVVCAQNQYAELVFDADISSKEISVINNDIDPQINNGFINWGKVNTLDANSDVLIFREATNVNGKTLTMIVKDKVNQKFSIGFKNADRSTTVFIDFENNEYALPDGSAGLFSVADVFEITYCGDYFLFRLNGKVVYIHKVALPDTFYGTIHLEEADRSESYLAMNDYTNEECTVEESDFVKSSFKMHIDKNINYVPVSSTDVVQLFFYQKYMVAPGNQEGVVKVYDRKHQLISAFGGQDELTFDKKYGRNFVEVDLSSLSLPTGTEYLMLEMSEVNKKSKYYLRLKLEE